MKKFLKIVLFFSFFTSIASAAVGAIDDMGDSCETVGAAKGLYAAEPDVTVTIK